MSAPTNSWFGGTRTSPFASPMSWVGARPKPRMPPRRPSSRRSRHWGGSGSAHLSVRGSFASVERGDQPREGDRAPGAARPAGRGCRGPPRETMRSHRPKGGPRAGAAPGAGGRGQRSPAGGSTGDCLPVLVRPVRGGDGRGARVPAGHGEVQALAGARTLAGGTIGRDGRWLRRSRTSFGPSGNGSSPPTPPA